MSARGGGRKNGRWLRGAGGRGPVDARRRGCVGTEGPRDQGCVGLAGALTPRPACERWPRHPQRPRRAHAVLDQCPREYLRFRMRVRIPQQPRALGLACAADSQPVQLLADEVAPPRRAEEPDPPPVFATTSVCRHGGDRKNGRWMPRGAATRDQAGTPSLLRESSTIVRPSIPGRPEMAASILRAPFRPSGPPMR